MSQHSSSLPNTTTAPRRARRSTPSPPHRSGGDVHVLVAGHNAGAAIADRRRRSPASPRCSTPTAPASPTAWRERRRAGARRRRQLQHLLFPATARARTSRRALPPARRGADQRHQGRQRRHLRAPDLRRQRHRHRAERRPAIKVITVRTTGFDPAAAGGGSARSRRSTRWPTAASRQATFVGAEIAKTTAPNSPRRQDHRLRRPRRWAATSSTKC